MCVQATEGAAQAQGTLRRLAKQISYQAQKNAVKPNFRSPWAGAPLSLALRACLDSSGPLIGWVAVAAQVHTMNQREHLSPWHCGFAACTKKQPARAQAGFWMVFAEDLSGAGMDAVERAKAGQGSIFQRMVPVGGKMDDCTAVVALVHDMPPPWA